MQVYQYIIDPQHGTPLELSSHSGRNVLKQYVKTLLSQSGGSGFGRGLGSGLGYGYRVAAKTAKKLKETISGTLVGSIEWDMENEYDNRWLKTLLGSDSGSESTDYPDLIKKKYNKQWLDLFIKSKRQEKVIATLQAKNAELEQTNKALGTRKTELEAEKDLLQQQKKEIEELNAALTEANREHASENSSLLERSTELREDTSLEENNSMLQNDLALADRLKLALDAIKEIKKTMEKNDRNSSNTDLPIKLDDESRSILGEHADDIQGILNASKDNVDQQIQNLFQDMRTEDIEKYKKELKQFYERLQGIKNNKSGNQPSKMQPPTAVHIHRLKRNDNP